MTSTDRRVSGRTASSAIAEPAVPPATPGDVRASGPVGTPRWGRLSWAFAGVWLVYLAPLVPEAIQRPHLWQRVPGLLALAAFAVAYVLVFWLTGRARRAGRAVPLERRIAALALGLALFAVLAVTVGEGALGLFVFLAVQGIFLLPRRTGLVLAGALIVVEEVLTRIVPGWQPDESLWLSIALASVAMWGVTGMIERNLELARAQATIAEMAVQSERTRFARDLHDILGHSLTVLTVKAELAGRLVGIDPERAGQEIAEVERLARQALVDVRAAVSSYREATLPGELASARAALEAAGIVAELPGAVDDVPPERRALLAWAIREGVTNVVRHSKARRVWVRLDGSGVEIADDGVGPDADREAPPPEEGAQQHGRAHGLVGLRERAAAGGARVVVGRRDGGGFVLRVGW